MTKKDYELIAVTIARAFIQMRNPAGREAVRTVVENFMVTLQAENPRFLPGRFRQYVEKVIGEAS